MYRVTEQKTYRTWEELSDKERDTLRYDSSIAQTLHEEIGEVIEELFTQELEDSDLPTDLNRRWSLNHSQGDGCSVTGRIALTTALLDRLVISSKDCKKVREHLENGEGFLSYVISSNSRRYCHDDTMYIELDDTDIEDVDEREVHCIGHSLLCYTQASCRAVERAGYDAIAYRESDEFVGKFCAANGILFDELGRPFWGLEEELENDHERFSHVERVEKVA